MTDTDHVLHDLTVSVALWGDMDAVHLEGDNSTVLPTDTQKNTVYAFAKEEGLLSIEDYGLALARHYVDDYAPVSGARIEIEQTCLARQHGSRQDVVRTAGHGNDVGFDDVRTVSAQRAADLTDGRVDVRLGEPALAPEVLQGRVEAVGQGGEHGWTSSSQGQDMLSVSRGPDAPGS